MDSLSLIDETLAPLAGKTLLDVGCGGGFLARSLASRGAEVVGIDPSPVEIDKARALGSAARFETARAEALPFADESFDAAIFLNSLHHVPGDQMAPALAEAGRVTRKAGVVIVVEPLAGGSFFWAFQPVEDETAVRAEAQAAVAEALRGGGFDLVRTVEFVRRERFDGLDAFVDRVTAVDPRRAAVIARDRDVIRRAFESHAIVDERGGFLLDQPLRAHILRHAKAHP